MFRKENVRYSATLYVEGFLEFGILKIILQYDNALTRSLKAISVCLCCLLEVKNCSLSLKKHCIPTFTKFFTQNTRPTTQMPGRVDYLSVFLLMTVFA